MSNGISSERQVETAVQQTAALIRSARDAGQKVIVVAGPVVVHTGGSAPLAKLIRAGYVQALLSGNALGVHDIEAALCGTSLGVRLADGRQEEHGHRNHMRAINAINHCGDIKGAVECGRLTSGIMYECVRNNVPFVLAGSLRDDGPLPDTVTDMNVAQDLCAQHLKGAGLVLCLGSMLHSIAIGNMSPSWVKIVCVDINPAVATKVSDRGTGQAVGVVTDVGLFLDHLCRMCSFRREAESERMKREYTDEQAVAGIDAPLPEIETWPNTYPGYEIEIVIPGVHLRLPQDRAARFRQADAALCAGQTLSRAEVAEDVHARVSQSRHLLRECRQPLSARRRERLQSDPRDADRRVHAARRHSIQDHGNLEQRSWLRRLTRARGARRNRPRDSRSCARPIPGRSA